MDWSRLFLKRFQDTDGLVGVPRFCWSANGPAADHAFVSSSSAATEFSCRSGPPAVSVLARAITHRSAIKVADLPTHLKPGYAG